MRTWCSARPRRSELVGTRRDIKGKGYEYDVSTGDGSEEPALTSRLWSVRAGARTVRLSMPALHRPMA